MVEEDLLGRLTTYWWAQLMRKKATQRCGAHGRLGALRPWELRLIESNVNCETASPVLVLGVVVNQACFAVDTHGIGYETALPQLVSRYIVNRACFRGDSDRIDSETALLVLVSGCVVN